MIKRNKKSADFDFRKVINSDIFNILSTNSLTEDVTIPDYSHSEIIAEQEQKALITASKLIPEVTDMITDLAKQVKIAKLKLEKRYPETAEYDTPSFVSEFYSILESLDVTITENRNKLNDLEL